MKPDFTTRMDCGEVLEVYGWPLRIIPCKACGGDGGFTEPVSMDPFSGRIREQVYACDACCGTGEIEIELQEIEMEDLEEMDGS